LIFGSLDRLKKEGSAGVEVSYFELLDAEAEDLVGTRRALLSGRARAQKENQRNDEKVVC
jgi:hypothetical protein